MTELKTQRAILDLNKVTHSVRSAQAILQYGVGAMVDFPDQTLMTAAPEYWGTKVKRIHDERLEKVLKVDYFGMPGRGDSDYDHGIAYARFPQWYFCPRCRKFDSLKYWVAQYKKHATEKQLEKNPHMKKPRCMECKIDLVPTRIVVACENGHIDDFPWVQWAHHKRPEGRKCSNPSLKFETGATASAGLEGLVVKCSNCQAKATLATAFEKNVMQEMAQKYGKGYSCTGNMPWKNMRTNCDLYPWARQRGASSLYYPKIVSSLVIPPYSDKINSKVETSRVYAKYLDVLSELDVDEQTGFAKARIDKWSTELSRDISANVNVVKHILTRRLINKNVDGEGLNPNGMNYRIEEYEALTGIINSNDLDGNDFVREGMDIERYNIPSINSISLIHKIREVRALTGFTRINPPDSYETGEKIPGFMPIKESETRWCPAYEVRGEGIFIEFGNEKITEWVDEYKEIANRAETINENYGRSFQGQVTTRYITAKYVLLHTIAHLLIRQLSFECGYTAASLRERIYCDTDNGYEMAGILIYTASGDSEGTLGGLVRQGYWDCFPQTFKKALQYGELCSNDPVCITSKGQGREALNLAACHTCVLLPETSCEDYNVFLDRALVTGVFENKEVGFYHQWLSE